MTVVRPSPFDLDLLPLPFLPFDASYLPGLVPQCAPTLLLIILDILGLGLNGALALRSVAQLSNRRLHIDQVVVEDNTSGNCDLNCNHQASSSQSMFDANSSLNLYHPCPCRENLHDLVLFFRQLDLNQKLGENVVDSVQCDVRVPQLVGSDSVTKGNLCSRVDVLSRLNA